MSDSRVTYRPEQQTPVNLYIDTRSISSGEEFLDRKVPPSLYCWYVYLYVTGNHQSRTFFLLRPIPLSLSSRWIYPTNSVRKTPPCKFVSVLTTPFYLGRCYYPYHKICLPTGSRFRDSTLTQKRTLPVWVHSIVLPSLCPLRNGILVWNCGTSIILFIFDLLSNSRDHTQIL